MNAHGYSKDSSLSIPVAVRRNNSSEQEEGSKAGPSPVLKSALIVRPPDTTTDRENCGRTHTRQKRPPMEPESASSTSMAVSLTGIVSSRKPGLRKASKTRFRYRLQTHTPITTGTCGIPKLSRLGIGRYRSTSLPAMAEIRSTLSHLWAWWSQSHPALTTRNTVREDHKTSC